MNSRSSDKQNESKIKIKKLSAKETPIKETEGLKIIPSRILSSSEPKTALIPPKEHFEGIADTSSPVNDENESKSKSKYNNNNII